MKSANELSRKSNKDIWNAFMVKKASFDIGTDMPICISSDIVPTTLISFDEAKNVYKNELKRNHFDFHVNAYIHFYIDDYKFDGKRSSIWTFPDQALRIIRHFEGIITPDFSTFSDFPDALKRYNTYRMRAFGCWMNALGIPVINNVRWGTYETWAYCFSGIPKGTTVAIGSVASGIKKLTNRPIFEEGLYRMIAVISPKRIVVYGSANFKFINNLKNQGIEVIAIPSKTSLAFQGRTHE